MKTYTWKEHKLPGDKSWRAAVYGGGKYLAAGNYGLALSEDGENWRMVSDGGDTPYSVLSTLAYGNGRYVCVAENTRAHVAFCAYVSTDGVNWSWNPESRINTCFVAFGQGMFVLSDGSTSTDGLNWTLDSTQKIDNSLGICYGNGKFVSVNAYGDIFTRSHDETAWHISHAAADWEFGESSDFVDLSYCDGLFFASAGGKMLRSVDGETWETVLNLPGQSIQRGTGVAGCYLTYATDIYGREKTYVSVDGTTWKEDGELPPFSLSCAGPEGFLGLRGDKCYAVQTASYLPDGETLMDGGKAADGLRYMALRGKQTAKPGQFFGKFSNGTFGFSDTFAPPENEIYVHCDGQNDLSKLQAALESLRTAGKRGVVYPVGELVLDINGNYGASGTKTILLDIPEGCVLDGRYCDKMTLDFTNTLPDNPGYLTVVQAGKRAVLRNFNIVCNGTPQSNYNMFFDTAAGYATLENNRFTDWKTISGFSWEQSIIYMRGGCGVVRGNVFDGMTLGGTGHSVIELDADGVVENNWFTGTIDSTSYMNAAALINCKGVGCVTGNVFKKLTAQIRLVWSSGMVEGNLLFDTSAREMFYLQDGAQASGNTFLRCTATEYFIRLSGASAVQNTWRSCILGKAETSVIELSGGKNTAAHNYILSLSKAADVEMGFGAISITSVGDGIIQGNQILLGGKNVVLYPIRIFNKSNCVVQANLTNHTTIGNITGQNNIVEHNIATGEIDLYG